MFNWMRWPFRADARALSELRSTIVAARAERTALSSLLAEAAALATDWRRGRAIVESLSKQAEISRLTIESVSEQVATLEALKLRLSEIEKLERHAVGVVEPLRTELSSAHETVQRLRTELAALVEEQAQVRVVAEEARRSSTAAERAAQQALTRLVPVEEKAGAAQQRLADIDRLVDKARSAADERVAAIERLADHVLQKTTGLEQQRASVDELLVEISRLKNVRVDLAEKLARFDVVLREARNALRTLQQDRDRLLREDPRRQSAV
jgi:uncharacterized coiled-coil DUF342 family protein